MIAAANAPENLRLSMSTSSAYSTSWRTLLTLGHCSWFLRDRPVLERTIPEISPKPEAKECFLTSSGTGATAPSMDREDPTMPFHDLTWAMTMERLPTPAMSAKHRIIGPSLRVPRRHGSYMVQLWFYRACHDSLSAVLSGTSRHSLGFAQRSDRKRRGGCPLLRIQEGESCPGAHPRIEGRLTDFHPKHHGQTSTRRHSPRMRSRARWQPGWTIVSGS